MTAGGLVCLGCGAVWYSAAAQTLSMEKGGCLTCGGKLEPRAHAPTGSAAERELADEPTGKPGYR